MFEKLVGLAEELNRAFALSDSDLEERQHAHSKMVQGIETEGVMEKIARFDSTHASRPLSAVMSQYMQMVLEMILFIGAVRTGDWELHLVALEAFTKHFFAHDKLNYARMIPLYLADMAALSETAEEIHAEFVQGNWVVNKNKHVSFCAIGADHALEHINRSMKVAGGLVGITLNPSARTKFFLIAPELARLSEEAQEMAGMSCSKQTHHHALSRSTQIRHEKNIAALTTTIQSFSNPFTDESKDLHNLVTKEIMPERVQKNLCELHIIGQKLFAEYVENRIRSDLVNIWAPMKKQKLKIWKETGKKLKVDTGDGKVELREDRNLFARMLLVSKSRPDINVAETVGKYELSVVPRSMFAADGSMLHCQKKSTLMTILEELPDQNEPSEQNEGRSDAIEQNSANNMEDSGTKVALVDAMAEVQSLDKPEQIKNCNQLAEHFVNRILNRYKDADEIRLIFDRYDVPMSLKTATREKRQGHQSHVSYHITDTTNIAKATMKRLLSTNKTKMELTCYLAEKMIERANEKSVVVAWGSHCNATDRSTTHLESSQEEADTKLLLHAVDATQSGASSIFIHSPDTDVCVLAPEFARTHILSLALARDIV